MPKVKISEYSTTNADNTDIEGINIAEGCAPSGINNAIRELMVHLKEFQTGASGDPLTVAGTFVASSGATIDGMVVGQGAGDVATNTAVGVSALAANTTGANNVAVGYQALDANTTGQRNTAVGSAALSAVTTGTRNTGIGYAALSSVTTGLYNTAVGASALELNTADNNTAIGYYALVLNTTGTNNTAVGYQALDANTTGIRNTAVGVGALGANTTGIDNCAFGVATLTNNTTGSSNIAMGYGALDTNSTGSNNTAIGYFSLLVNTTASNNTAVGYQAGYSNTTGSITALGYRAGYANTTGTNNVAIGGLISGVNWTLASNTTGSHNVAIGDAALGDNTTASYNVAVGSYALENNTTGASNTAVGYNAGGAVTTGTNNVLIGYIAGSGATIDLTTGSSNICIGGNRPSPSASSGAHQIVIGTTASVAGKGDSTGFINANGGGNYAGNNSASWSTTSDQRLKKNIVDNNQGLEIINQIRVRNFEYRLPEEITELDPKYAINIPGVQLGPIAQELQQVCPDCVTEESTGVLGVDSDDVFWHLVNAVKQLSSQVTALQSEVNQLKGN